MSNSQQGNADRPVFIVGCARSGNTLMYDTLVSSRAFANYRAEPAVFDLFLPKFGNISVRENRDKLIATWLDSVMFRKSGLQRRDIVEKLLACRTGGQFLATLMDETARSQGVRRWAVWGPDNLLYIPQIKKELPAALFIHMIRDGRDVATSLNKEKWIRPLPFDGNNGLLVAGLHWRWKVEHGREHGRKVGQDYLEIHYEELVGSPVRTLQRVSEFIGYELDYKYIQENAIGAPVTPNSSFLSPTNDFETPPIGRWRQLLSKSDAAMLNAALEPLLLELGYDVPPDGAVVPHSAILLRKMIYAAFSDAKLWGKTRTPLGRFTDTSRLKLEHPSIGS